jgi:hypothetical protein
MRRIIVVGSAILLVLAVGTVVRAAIPAADGTITGCRDNRTGALRVIDAEAGQSCGSREALLTWNQTGPAGPQGPAGANGVSGYEVVTAAGMGGFTATVTCPTGKQAISGGAHWNGLTRDPIENFRLVGSYPTADRTGWTVEYDLRGNTVDAYAICAIT